MEMGHPQTPAVFHMKETGDAQAEHDSKKSKYLSAYWERTGVLSPSAAERGRFHNLRV